MAPDIPGKGEWIMTKSICVLRGNNGRLAISCLQPAAYRQFITCSLLAVFLILCFGADAYAQVPALQYCDNMRGQYPGQFLYPLILCLTEPPSGFIPSTTTAVMQNLSTFYLPAIRALAIFLVCWFGLKLMLGDIQNIKGDTFTMLFKISGVFYFCDNASTIYTDIIAMMNNLNDIISQIIIQSATHVFCTSSNPPWTLWQDLDCIIGWVLGIGIVAAVLGLIAIILLIIFTGGTGIPIVFAIFYLIATVFFAIARFAQYYIMSVMSLSFMFVLGYLFVPLLFFRHSFQYFQKWLAYCIAYMLIPFVMYAYVALLFVVLDDAIYSGPTSIMYEIAGAQKVANMQSGAPATNPLNAIQGPKNGNGSNTKYYVTQKHSVFKFGIEKHGDTVASDVGSGGTMGDNGQSAEQFNSEKHDTMLDSAFSNGSIDWNSLALDQGDGKTVEQYQIDIALSIFVAALLAYIMLSLMSYIPEVASSLVSQGTQAGKQIVKAEVFGEAAVMQTLELAKAVADASTGNIKDAAKSIGKTAANMAQKMAQNRGKH